MNNTEQFQRTELLIGSESIEKLNNATVAVFGLGGVGSFAAEALARAGVGNFLLVDGDVISITNINRQLLALHSTIGKQKVQVMMQRILDINPNANISVISDYYTTENQDIIDFSTISYILDAIDMVTSKLLLITKAKQYSIPIISCMGTGNKLNPTAFIVDDITKTSVCPLAKVMRKLCKERGLKSVKVVYSKELPLKPSVLTENLPNAKRQIPGSISFVPSSAGLLMAGEAIKELISMHSQSTSK